MKSGFSPFLAFIILGIVCSAQIYVVDTSQTKCHNTSYGNNLWRRPLQSLTP